jgi:hypothetical protein
MFSVGFAARTAGRVRRTGVLSAARTECWRSSSRAGGRARIPSPCRGTRASASPVSGPGGPSTQFTMKSQDRDGVYRDKMPNRGTNEPPSIFVTLVRRSAGASARSVCRDSRDDDGHEPGDEGSLGNARRRGGRPRPRLRARTYHVGTLAPCTRHVV